MISRNVLALSAALTFSVVAHAPLAAQKPAAPAQPSIIGTWMGTVTVPLGDSTIVVPVSYMFTQASGAIGGTAMVPGQGTGTISNLVRDGAKIQFRVTVAPMQPNTETRLLEHDGKLSADGVMEGMVTLNKQPVAKFKITLKKP